MSSENIADDLRRRGATGSALIRMVTPTEVASWPPGTLQTLLDNGLLEPDEPEQLVECPECGDHWDPVTWVGDRPRIFCERVGLVAVDPSEMARWRICILDPDQPATVGHVDYHAVSQETGYTFRQDSTGWVLSFGSSPFHLPRLKGLDDIHTLLTRTNESLLAVDFAEDLLVQGGLETTDFEAIGRLRTHLDAGGAGADAAAIRRYLRRTTTPRGAPRKGSSPVTKAAGAIRNRIRRALAGIDAVNPEMALHLRKSIETGVTLRYRSPQQIDWRT